MMKMFKMNMTRWFLPVLLSLASASTAFAQSSEPEIEEMQLSGSNVVMQILIEAGYDILQLEVKSGTEDEDLGWVPRKVVSLSGAAEMMPLVIPAEHLNETFRVRCYTQSDLDVDLTAGQSDFSPNSVVQEPDPPTAYESVDADGGGGEDPAPSEGGDREVVDSDIWALTDTRAFFFNRSRGFQIIDITSADEPALLSTLDVDASGERMFLVDDQHVALFTTTYCYGDPDSRGEVLILNVAADSPSIVDRFAIRGGVREARMVGTALYVVGYRSSYIEEDGYTLDTVIDSFDLSDPSNAQPVDSVIKEGWPRFVHASQEFLILGSTSFTSYWQTTLSLFDIRSPAGDLIDLTEMEIGGRISDEYKIKVTPEHLFIFAWHNETSVTRLHSFSMTDPAAPVALHQVEVGLGERLFATRFHGPYAYAVTFRQIDPLWVIDISDPAAMSVEGELEVPGFSTYIHPMDGRLLTIGREERKVAVSLFDVQDPTNPTLLSRIFPGSNSYSYSESIYEEQAFQVIESENLVMLPFTSRGQRALQLIDLFEDELVERGVVEHRYTPRRSTSQGNRLFTVSSERFVSINANDRDAPFIAGEVDLLDPVTSLFLHDSLLVELYTPNRYRFWNANEFDNALTGEIRVRDADSMELLAKQDLPAGRYIGTYHDDDFLTLIYSVGNDSTQSVSSLVYNLDILPGFFRAEASLGTFTEFAYVYSLTPHRVKDDLLTWQFFGGWLYDYSTPIGGDDLDAYYPYYYSEPQSRFLTLDVASPMTPELVSLSSNLVGFSGNIFVANDHMYSGYTDVDYVPVPSEYSEIHSSYSISGFREEHFAMQVLDFTNDDPVLKPSVSLPGNLLWMNDSGDKLMTHRRYVSFDTYFTSREQTNVIHALHFDGTAAYLLDEMNFGEGYLNVQPFKNRLLKVNRDYAKDQWSLDTIALLPTHKLGVTQNLVVPAHAYWQGVGSLDMIRISSPDHSFYQVPIDPTLPITPIPNFSAELSCRYLNYRKADGSVDGLYFPSYNSGTIRILPSP